MEPNGLEPSTFWLRTRGFSDVSSCGIRTGADAEGGCGTVGCTSSPENVPESVEITADLALVVKRWSDLPAPARQHIVDVVRKVAHDQVVTE